MSYHSSRGRSSLGLTTGPSASNVVIRDHRAGAPAPTFVQHQGQTFAQAQAAAVANPAGAADEAARLTNLPGYKPPEAPTPLPDGFSIDQGGGTVFGIPTLYLIGGAGLLALLLLRRKKAGAAVPSP